MINALDHININTERLTETRDFYVNLLGLTDGARPPFPFAGNWLYSGDQAVIHLMGSNAGDPPAQGPGSGAVDHVAFSANDIDAVRRRLEAENIPYKHAKVPDSDLQQLFIKDPNDITVELNFYPSN